MPHYKLTYYDARGSAEPCRMMFAYAGVEYIDIRIPIGTLTPQRLKELKLRTDQLPALEVNGHEFTQSHAISKYLATKLGLMGDTDIEALRIDECIYVLSDYIRKWTPLFYDCIPIEKKDEVRRKLMETENVYAMGHLDSIYTKNLQMDNQWLVGNRISWADIAFAHITSNFEDCLFLTDVIKDYPHLQELRRRVLEVKLIKEYISTRPETKF